MGTLCPFCLYLRLSPGVGMNVIFDVELEPLTGGGLTAAGPANGHTLPATNGTACGPSGICISYISEINTITHLKHYKMEQQKSINQANVNPNT
jgi:predicted NBD/HSP70 family sugar kinase